MRHAHEVQEHLGRRLQDAVSRLFVPPATRGRGVAVALLARATEAARGTGRTVELDVVEDSVAAIRRYERLGWTLVDFAPAPFTRPDGSRPTQTSLPRAGYDREGTAR